MEFDRFILRDVVVNVALYIPAGFTGHLAFRRFGKTWLSLTAPVLICTAWSASIEMVQLFVPSRTTSALDWATNIAGSAIGVFLAIILEGIFLQRRTRPTSRKSLKPRKAPDRAALALLGCWVMWLWFPIFPVMGRTLLEHKASVFLETPVVDPVLFFAFTLAWFAAGSLLQAGGLRPARRFTAISVALIPAQLFVVDRQPVPAALAGAAAGAALFAVFWPQRKAHGNAYRKITAWAFLSVIIVRGLAPFQFSAAAVPFSWIPFSGFLNMNWQTGVQVIAEKFFWYGTAIWLMRASGMRARSATALVAAVLLGIEIAQTHLPGHIAEITDPLWAIFTSCAIYILARDARSQGSQPASDG